MTTNVPALGKPAVFGETILQRRMELIATMGSFSGNRLLDVGCGNGAQTIHFLTHFKEIVGIDVVPEHIDEFQKVIKELHASNCSARMYDGQQLPFSDGSFDSAICIETIEHVRSERLVLSEIHRVLRKNGTLILSAPNKWWPFETHGARLPFLSWNRVPFFSWLPQWAHQRVARARIYTRRKIVRLVEANGFVVEEMRYLTAPLDRISISWIRKLLRKSIFAHPTTQYAILAPAIFLKLRKVDTRR